MSFVDVGTHPSRVLRERGVALPYESGAGLGAFTRNGFTVRYYAAPGTLSFKDAKFRNMYESMRNADIDFQKQIKDVVKNIAPFFGWIEAFSGGALKASDLSAASKLELPTKGPALLLEVAAGNRPVNDAFKNLMRTYADDMARATAIFGIVTGLNVVAIALGVPPLPTAAVFGPLLPLTGFLAGLAGTGTLVAATTRPIFDAIARGIPPSPKQMKAALDGAAALSGGKGPTDAEAAALSAAFGNSFSAPADRTAIEAAKAKRAALLNAPAIVRALEANAGRGFLAERTKAALRERAIVTAVKENTAKFSASSSSDDFPWLLAGGAALAGIGGLALVMRRRR